MMEIKMLKKVDLEGATFVEGFPGIGLVGPMSISYMIDKLAMDYLASALPKYLMPYYPQIYIPGNAFNCYDVASRCCLCW